VALKNDASSFLMPNMLSRSIVNFSKVLYYVKRMEINYLKKYIYCIKFLKQIHLKNDLLKIKSTVQNVQNDIYMIRLRVSESLY